MQELSSLELQEDTDPTQISHIDYEVARGLLEAGIFQSMLRYFNWISETKSLILSNLSKLHALKLEMEKASSSGVDKIKQEEFNYETELVISNLNNQINSSYQLMIQKLLSLNDLIEIPVRISKANKYKNCVEKYNNDEDRYKNCHSESITLTTIDLKKIEFNLISYSNQQLTLLNVCKTRSCLSSIASDYLGWAKFVLSLNRDIEGIGRISARLTKNPIP